jgi:hypothetical protein
MYCTYWAMHDTKAQNGGNLTEIAVKPEQWELALVGNDKLIIFGSGQKLPRHFKVFFR